MNRNNDAVVTSSHNSEHVTLAGYVAGFIASIVLTVTAFMLVKTHIAHHHAYPSDNFMILALPFLAIAQFCAQIYFFLHLGRETKPRWKLLVLIFMILIVLIIVVGSLWIMHNLSYRMTPQQMNQYMINQNGGI